MHEIRIRTVCDATSCGGVTYLETEEN